MGTVDELEHGASNAAAVINTVERLHGVKFVDAERIGRGGKIAFAVVPEGMALQSLKSIHDEFAPAPERIAGTAQLKDERSFITHVTRFKQDATTIFADPSFSAPSLLAVYDYHDHDSIDDEQIPAWCSHRAQWLLKLSREWQAWSAQAGKPMSHAEFAEYLEKHVPDVYWGDDLSEYTKLLISTLDLKLATPSKLVELSRNLAVNVDTTVKSAQTLSSGEIALTYTETHRDGEGQPVKVPNAFLIAVPVVEGGPLYQILVRLRYRIRDGKVAWMFDLHRVDLVFEKAFEEICDRVRTETVLPVLLGSAEK